MKFFDLDIGDELAKLGRKKTRTNQSEQNDLKAFNLHSLACSQVPLLYSASQCRQ